MSGFDSYPHGTGLQFVHPGDFSFLHELKVATP
jgi:hypothetical protein